MVNNVACLLVARASNQQLKTYSPIARILLVMDGAVQAHMKRKLDICYVMTKEGLGFPKCPD